MPRGLVLLLALAFASAPLRADPELVIAIRYLQAKGVSHAHLYLYREDGKLLRQLTSDNSGQDVSPIFSPDGTTIVFRRDLSGDAKEYWSVEPLGTHLQKLAAPPEWYTKSQDAVFFTNLELPETEKPAAPAAKPDAPPAFKTADGSAEIVMRVDPKDPDDEVDGPGHGRHFLLRDLKTGKETSFGEIPEFYGVYDLLHEQREPYRRFYHDGSVHLAFFGLHLDSTDGDTAFALDLVTPRFVRLSPNFALPVPLPGEGAFLTFTENRYVPIPDSPKTANCSYVERWDAKLKNIRYARPGTAAICYGFSMYRPKLTPAVINLAGHGN